MCAVDGSEGVRLAARVPNAIASRGLRQPIAGPGAGNGLFGPSARIPEQRLLENFVYARPRFNLLLFSIFAGLGLILALLGIYGVVSSTTAHRTHEIGIRLALGATVREVIMMVLTSGPKRVALGVVVGLVGSLLSVHVLQREVWNLSTFDPYAFAGVSILVLLAGLLACFVPARSAARVDPISALRHE
jgi:ABC-type antimicrobial peptide transport system permease subunit